MGKDIVDRICAYSMTVEDDQGYRPAMSVGAIVAICVSSVISIVAITLLVLAAIVLL